MAPLPGSENNNKPGVKLPAVVDLAEKGSTNLTILEAVMKQTGVYALSRGGRISVYWGDQVFIPSAPVEYDAKHHIDILCSLGPMLTAEQWEEKGMQKYGLIAVNTAGNAAQVEKVTHATATRLLASLGELEKVGVSLGSFSMSYGILDRMLGEFAKEIAAKEGKLDTDPHFWMPLTLPVQSYIEIMEQKGVDREKSLAHHERMQAMWSDFSKTDSLGLGLFGAVDVGSSCYWWDYGQLRLYHCNNFLMTKDSEEAAACRAFYSVSDGHTKGSQINLEKVTVCDRSLVLSSTIPSGSINTSFISNSTVLGSADVKDCIMVRSTVKSVKGSGFILYNVCSDEDLELQPGDVVAQVYSPDGTSVLMRTKLDIDSGKKWKEVLDGNPKSFEQIYFDNQTVDISAAFQAADRQHDKLAQTKL